MNSKLPKEMQELLDELRQGPSVEQVKLKQIHDIWSAGFPISCLPWFNYLFKENKHK